ncbi:MAG: tetratricopeptide repeat protein, partial [Anaerolineae bacterium]
MQKSLTTAKTLWLNKGIRHANEGRYDKAIACFGRALEFDPRNAYAWFFKANCLGETDRFEEAISCYNQCLGISPDDAEALSRKGL